MLLYALIGAGMASALGDQTTKGALFAGILAPALITNAINGAQDSRPSPSPKVEAALVSFLISPAHAQSTTGTDGFTFASSKIFGMKAAASQHWFDSLPGTQKAEVKKAANSDDLKAVSFTGTNPAGAMGAEVDVCFVGMSETAVVPYIAGPVNKTETGTKKGTTPADNTFFDCTAKQKLTVSPGATQTLLAPPNAVAVTVAGKTFLLNKPHSQLGVTFQTRTTAKNDFWWALGGSRDLSVTAVGANSLDGGEKAMTAVTFHGS
jgi:hypothetical protein